MTFDKYIKAYWLVITIGLICAGISGAIVHEFASRTAGIVVGLIVGGTVAAIVGGISARRRGNLRKRRRRGRRTIDCENVVRSLQPRGHVFIEDPTGRHRYRHLEVSGFYTILSARFTATYFSSSESTRQVSQHSRQKPEALLEIGRPVPRFISNAIASVGSLRHGSEAVSSQCVPLTPTERIGSHITRNDTLTFRHHVNIRVRVCKRLWVLKNSLARN